MKARRLTAFAMVLLLMLSITVNAVDTSVCLSNGVLKTCRGCGKRTMIVTCGSYAGEYPDTDCYILSHHQPCVTMNRIKYLSFGVCSSYGLGDTSAGRGTYEYDEHVESCQHSSTDDVVYITCPYK